MPIFFRKGSIVAPGDVVAEGTYKAGNGIVKIGNKYISLYMGIFDIDIDNTLHVIPFKNIYIPNVGDIVIGKIRDVGVTSWLVDINSPYPGVLLVSETLSRPIDVSRIDLRTILDIGDVIVAKVIEFDLLRDPMLTIKESRLGKVNQGLLLEFQPSLYYSIIENRLKMIEKIKDKLECDIIIGKNGRVVILGAQEKLDQVVRILNMIFQDFSVGSTDRIKRYIEKL